MYDEVSGCKTLTSQTSQTSIGRSRRSAVGKCLFIMFALIGSRAPTCHWPSILRLPCVLRSAFSADSLFRSVSYGHMLFLSRASQIVTLVARGSKFDMPGPQILLQRLKKQEVVVQVTTGSGGDCRGVVPTSVQDPYLIEQSVESHKR